MLKHTLLVICTFLASSCNCAAFLQSTATRQVEVSAGKCHRPSLLKVASTSSIVASLDGINTKDASDELISLLIKRRCGRRNEYDDERISSLVDTLTSARARFDPTICLDGPLFVSNVVEGPPPLWERFGLKFGGSNDGEKNNIGNIQGQQYFYRDDEKSVVNYAEIIGKAFHVRAYGTCERDENDINEASAIKKDNSSMLDNVIGLFGGNKFPSAQKAGNMIN